MPYISGVKHLTLKESSRATGLPRSELLAAIRYKKLLARWNRRHRLCILRRELDHYVAEHVNTSVDAIARRRRAREGADGSGQLERRPGGDSA